MNLLQSEADIPVRPAPSRRGSGAAARAAVALSGLLIAAGPALAAAADAGGPDERGPASSSQGAAVVPTFAPIFAPLGPEILSVAGLLAHARPAWSSVAFIYTGKGSVHFVASDDERALGGSGDARIRVRAGSGQAPPELRPRRNAGGLLVVEVTGSGRADETLEVSVPEAYFDGFRDIVLRSRDGSVSASGAFSKNGPARLGTFELRSDNGRASLNRFYFDGRASVFAGKGAFVANATAAEFILESYGGAVATESVDGRARIRTLDGPVTLGRRHSWVSVETQFGAVRIEPSFELAPSTLEPESPTRAEAKLGPRARFEAPASHPFVVDRGLSGLRSCSAHFARP